MTTSLNNKRVYKPSILQFLIILIILPSTIFIMTGKLLNEKISHDNYNFLIYSAVIIISFFSLIFFLDVWIVKIGNDKIYIRRLWQKNWKQLFPGDFYKIKFKANKGEDIFQQLTIYSKEDGRIKFKVWNEKMGKSLFKDLLEKTPDLLKEYEKMVLKFEKT